MKYDVFICHASEDKDDFVRPLSEKLQQQHIEVWYDEFSLQVGDSLMEKIDEGLAMSEYGIVVLSKNFFQKPWAKRELKGFNIRELSEKREVILPIWHKINLTDVLEYSAPLADKVALSSELGINTLIRKLKEKIKPEESPLIVAQEYLSNLNVESPIISDEWWLNIIEYKEQLKYPDLNARFRWIFPLPYPDSDHGRNRGINIANSALQSDWSFDGEELDISPLTNPEIVHQYIRKWPGLYDYSRANANILALYAPQLTMPEFDSGFEDVFDDLLKPNNPKSNVIFSYSSFDTIDGKEPLCGDIIAYRHPSFGNYKIDTISRSYFYAHNTSYLRSNYDLFEGLIWLLSSGSNWLPERYRDTFITGILTRDTWINQNTEFWSNEFIEELRKKSRNEFAFTKSVTTGLIDLISQTLNELNIKDDPNRIVKQFKDRGIIDLHFEFQQQLNEKKKSST